MRMNILSILIYYRLIKRIIIKKSDNYIKYFLTIKKIKRMIIFKFSQIFIMCGSCGNVHIKI